MAAMLVFAGALPLHAAPDAVYDVFAKTLAPFAASVFGSGPGQPGAMVAECLVTEGTGSLAAAKGVRFRLAVQGPEHLRVDVIRDKIKLTASRDGRELWAAPEDVMRILAQAAGIDLSQSAPDAAPTPLLPVMLNAQMLTFLPVVFDVKDLGTEGEPPLRILEFSLLRELREAMKAEEFSGRVWVGEKYQPSRLIFTTPEGSLDIAIEKLNFAESLPSGAWQPEAGTTPLRLPASALNHLFEKMLGAK